MESKDRATLLLTLLFLANAQAYTPSRKESAPIIIAEQPLNGQQQAPQEEAEEVCTICYASEKETAVGIVFTCGHEKDFCSPCITTWTMEHETCPLCRKSTENINKKLFTAIEKNTVKSVLSALDQGADVNCQHPDGWKPLIYAAKIGNYRLVSALLEAGANVNDTTPNNTTALMIAVLKERYRVTRLLLEHGADKSIRKEDGSTALFYARYYNQRQGIAQLIENHD